MSLLSPKKIHIGLCCGKCWLTVGKLHVERVTEIDSNVDSNSLQQFFVQALTSMLEEVKSKIKKGNTVYITVSDRIGLSSTLPWQDTAMSTAELESFAAFWLAKFGMKIDESHLLFADYPRYQSIGIAYALPKVFVEALVSVVENISLKLVRVIPVSAAVFFSTHFKNIYPSSVTICEESHCLSGWISDHEGKFYCEIEPVTGSQDQALKRLLSRIGARHTEIKTLAYWGVTKERLPSELRNCFPVVKLVNTLERECWIKS